MAHPHISVLLQEWLEALQNKQILTYVDCTLGAGGHAEAVLHKHPEITKFIGMDQDQHALQIAKKRLEPWKSRIQLIHSNFSELESILKESADAILIDLGVSSMQLDEKERGFSFQQEGPLDMRMDQTAELTAEEVINTFSEEELGEIFRDYGEEKRWRRAAAAVVHHRGKHPIKTTKDLVDALKPAFPGYFKKGISPYTLVFQGLRIYVNRELDVLETVLPHAIERLNPGGILGIISFHSLEDRIVKNRFREAAANRFPLDAPVDLAQPRDPIVRLVTRKPLTAGEEELKLNPRSRSAKMRIVEKL